MQIPQREPNGRHSRMDANERPSPAAAKRLRDNAIKGVSDERWGTELGRLFLAGDITEDLYEAGRRWGELVADYYRAIGASAPYPKAVNLERYERSAEVDPESEKGKERDRRAEAKVEEMDKALAALLASGSVPMRIVRTVCETNESAANWHERIALGHGLSALAIHWKLKKGS